MSGMEDYYRNEQWSKQGFSCIYAEEEMVVMVMMIKFRDLPLFMSEYGQREKKDLKHFWKKSQEN